MAGTHGESVVGARLTCFTCAHTQTQDGSTALICAAANGHMAFVQLLLDAGADKEAKDKVHYFLAASAGPLAV